MRKYRRHLVLAAIVASAGLGQSLDKEYVRMNGRVIVVRRPNQPITVNVTPANQSVNLGLAVQFVATVNNATNPAANWTLSPNIGTINSGGLYIATTPVAVNTNITVTATSVQDPSKFHSVTLTVMPAIAVSVSPNSYTLAAGSSPYQFAAFVANNINQAVTWSIDAGGVGTVTTSGLYSPPAAGAASAVLRRPPRHQRRRPYQERHRHHHRNGPGRWRALHHYHRATTAQYLPRWSLLHHCRQRRQ